MSNPFGSPFGSQPTAPVFGGIAGNLFGQTQSTTSSVQETLPPPPSYSSSVFGQSSNPSQVFGQSSNPSQVFGQSSNPSQVFGQSSNPSQVFGQSSNASQVFGQSSNPSQVFGQSSNPSQVFGQSSNPSQVFGQSSNPSQVFGQSSNASQVFGQSSNASQVFGQSSNSSQVFGQSSNSSQSTTSGQSSLFSNSSQGIASSGANVFGNTTFGTFGQSSNTPSPSLFGNSGQQNTVQSTTLSFVQPATQAGLFSSRGSTSFSTADVKHETPASSPFGGLSNVKSEPISGFQTSAGLFGKVPLSSSSTVGSSSLFGKPAAERVGSVYAERVDVKPQLFGIGSTENQDVKPVGLFGKVKQEKNVESAETKQLFGGSRIKQEGQSEGTAEAGGARGTGLFGKGKTFNQTLFGKSVKEEGRSSRPDPVNEDENPLQQHSEDRNTRSSARGLFGKPAYREEKLASGTGLFGKPTISREPTSSDEKDESSRHSLRRQVSDEVGSKVAIVCRNIPHKYNTIIFLRTHFKRFGEVTKVFPNQAKMQATIHFKTHDAAADAKRRGRILARGVLPMTIFWSTYSGGSAPKTTKSTSDAEAKPSRPVKRTSDSVLLPQSKKPSWKGSGNVNEELESMSGTQDIKGRVTELARSPEKQTRSVSPTPSATSYDIKADKIVVGMFEGIVAKTTTERVNILRLRDKYIRENRVKGKKDMVKAFVGTCPDMCPEKERYDREDKRQLSYFEIIPGTENIPGKNPQIDHRRAVKEYLRSSPDQDEPLPHELRPMPVLHSTMTYLLREVADRGEDGRWGDWFDFFWNRTRGIRKDIIQQQLNDRNAVDLIEKCARFHIYCSERLCEEDMHSFDAKINNENLTKCLQTLKEFYPDLEKKQKCYCLNEAEFRAYMVLMNLNQGDTLREVQQLRPEVRTSPEIKFALQSYFALNGNNYIKFFRLVRQASFSNACIMHRYFTQVRSRALTLMMRGYSMGNRAAQIPVTEIVRLLAFENETEASDFCQHYGLNVNDGEVVLDKAEYIEPDTAWAPVRSVNLIESKLVVTVGEFINGAAFDDTKDIVPVSSFDEYSRFHSLIELPRKGFEAAGSSKATSNPQQPISVARIQQEPDTIKEEEVKVKAEQPDTGPVEADKPSLKKVPVEFIKESAKFLFWEVIDELCSGIGQEIKQEVDAKLHISVDCVETIVESTLTEDVRNICEQTYDQALADRHKSLQLEKELRQDRVAEQITGDIINELMSQEALNLATIEMREVKAELKRQCIERVTVDVNKDLVEEVMKEMVGEVSEDVFETDVRQRLKQLDDFEKLVKLSRVGRFWLKWKKEYKAVTKLKRAMEDFPCAPNMQSNQEVINRLLNVDDDRIVDKKFYVNKRARLTIETPLDIERRRKETETLALVHRLYKNLLHQNAWSPIDLGRLVGQDLKRKYKPRQQPNTLKAATIFWKLLLCLPEVTDGKVNNQSEAGTHNLCKWLKVKLSKGPTPLSQNDVKGKVISLYKCHTSESSSYKPVSLNVCVRTVEGQLQDDDVTMIEENTLFLGTSALIFLMPAGAPFQNPNSPGYDMYWTGQHFRLEAILDVKPRYQAFPLVIVLPVSANQTISLIDVIERLSLGEFLDADLLSDVELITYELNENRPDGIDLTDPKISEELCEGIQWLAKKTRPAPGLTVQYFKDVVDLSLHKYYHTPVQYNHKKRKDLNRLNKDPNSLLLLYNSVISHLVEVLTSDTLYKVSWPVAEFTSNLNSDLPPNHWNKGDHMEYLFKIVDSLRLPKLKIGNLDTDEWFEVKRDLWEFVSSFAGSDYSGARVKLFSRLKNLLHKLEEDFEEACYFQYGEADCKPTFHNVPWSSFISFCIDYKLDSIDLVDPDTPNPQERHELKVAYIKEEMEGFIPPESWTHIEAESSVLESPSLEDTVRNVVLKVQEERKQAETKAEITVTEDPGNVSVIAKESKKTSSLLSMSIKSERRQSDHFQKFLENALKEVQPQFESSFSRNSSFSVFERENDESFGAGNFTLAANQRRFSLDPMVNQRRDSFDATAYFDQSQNDISSIFAPQTEGRLLLPPSRRKSDIGLQELSVLPGKKRRQRLSEIYDNDKVMMYIKEPTLSEDAANFKENLKSNRRDSDLYEKRLKMLLQGSPETF